LLTYAQLFILTVATYKLRCLSPKRDRRSSQIEDCGLSPDLFETFKKIAEDDDGFDNDALYRCIVQAGKTIKVLKETFNEDYPAILSQIMPMFRQLQADNDPRKGKIESDRKFMQSSR
jgi:hypothetical protein